MFGDIVKLATRTGAVLVVIGTVVGLLSLIQVPAPDYTAFSDIIGRGYAFMSHWIPLFPQLWQIFTVVFGSWLALQLGRLAIYTGSIILKIFK